MSRKVCVVTGSRADYGLLRWVMEGIRQATDLQLQVVATGMHLSPRFGLTQREIENDGFKIDFQVDMQLDSDSPAGIARSMGIGLSGFGRALEDLRPDLMLALGDRFEIFAAVAAALVARVPVGHLHGGETTEGSFDEALRHSITKMSHLHFVAAEEYRRRVIQLGEAPERVFLVGGLGIENILKLPLLDRPALEAALGFELKRRNLLVTFLPATLDKESAESQFAELLAALELLKDTRLIFTMPNADPGGGALLEMVEQFVARNENARASTSLGQLLYLSCMRHVDGVVGNSSSGLCEAPSLRTGTINIGDRQRGRLKAASVIDCPADRKTIAAALQRLYSAEFQEMLTNVRNPYGESAASGKIVPILQTYPLETILKKSFYDLPRPGRA
jgi:GDP/UDP-N,N'-diacetylbacillosamine 2-epimerase (hydrolysing)